MYIYNNNIKPQASSTCMTKQASAPLTPESLNRQPHTQALWEIADASRDDAEAEHAAIAQVTSPSG